MPVVSFHASEGSSHATIDARADELIEAATLDIPPVGSDVDEHMHLLRAAIQVKLPAPLVLAVISATDDDGRAALCIGLTRAFLAAGASTALLHGADASFKAFDNLTTVAIGDLLESGSITRHIADLHTRFDVVLVDVALAAATAPYVDTLRAAGGALVAFRTGRALTKADTRLALALEHLEVKTVGIALTAAR